MGAVTAEQMRQLEASAFRAGATPAGLMEKAGRRIGMAVQRQFPKPGTAIAYLGKGHNAGDALVALQILKKNDWHVAVRPAFPAHEWASLTRANFRALGEVPVLNCPFDTPDLPRPLILLDGLLGIGARGGLRAPLVDLAAEMQSLRERFGARIIAVDLPSGIDADSGEIFDGAVHADQTWMIGAPKRGALASSATPATGALGLIPLSELPAPAAEGLALISPQTFPSSLGPRPFEFHKGQAGRVGIVAGSRQYRGAAILAASGALRTGAGLVTLYLPEDAIDWIAPGCPPEVIIRSYTDFAFMLQDRQDAWVAGPGLGISVPQKDLVHALSRTPAPMVVDADALNALAQTGIPQDFPSHRVLTPHPGEFHRLAPTLRDLTREEAVRTFTSQYAPVLLLKGARTLVTAADQPLWCNATGTPAMACGGQGDILSGVIGSFMASGKAPLEAAALGAWLCGRAAELTLIDRNHDEHSSLPSDCLTHLGRAFLDWNEKTR